MASLTPQPSWIDANLGAVRVELTGATIVVTGASSGIGKELARQLAPRAAAIALVARRLDRLVELADELRAANPKLRVHVETCDLGDRDAALALGPALEEALGQVDVLINNAGLGVMGVFDQTERARTVGMIEVNVTSLVVLTHALLPGMVARGKGGILNVSSGFGVAFAPGFAAYIGTKHFVTGFTESLRLDLAGTGVVATQVCPGPVATEFEAVAGNFTGQDPPKLVQISAEQCARESLRGFERGRALIYPGFVYRWMMRSLAWVPRFLQRWTMAPAGRWLRKKQATLGASTP